MAATRDDAWLPNLTEAAFDPVVPRAPHHGAVVFLVARPEVLERLPGKGGSALQSQARAGTLREPRHLRRLCDRLRRARHRPS